MSLIVNNRQPTGRDVSGAQKASHWVGSRADENEKTAKFRDKKFEGYSELKPGYDATRTGRGRGEVDDKTLKQLEDEYILNLQKQIALMEQELKLLKERELEQNKSAAGYEVLLKDGIPVNEHFIALKNKYNVEKDSWEKKLNNQDEDNKSELKNNKERQHKIEILSHEFEVISDRHNYFKVETTNKIEDLDSKIFHETNTIDKLTAKRDDLNSKLTELETENAQLERLIARNKMFNKKPELIRKRNEEIEKWDKKVRELTEEIAKKDFELYSQTMKLEDKDLIKKENETLLKEAQKFNRLEIEINIAKSRIKELEGIKHMNIRILQDIYTEIRDLESDNDHMTKSLEPDAMDDANFLEMLEVREKEKIVELNTTIKADSAYVEHILNVLKDEEGKAKDMLDEKVRLENELKLNQEDLNKYKSTVSDNDDELVTLKSLKFFLSTKKDRLTGEVDQMTKENDDYISRNEELEAENNIVEGKIRSLMQKIEINNLMKEINIDDLTLATKNNQSVNQLLMNMMNKWEQVNLQE
jgi:FtsZ-binding cell division protein ZapB